MKKVKYIAGATAAAGFCLTALVLSSGPKVDTQVVQLKETTQPITISESDDYTQPITPELIQEIKAAGLSYDEKDELVEQAALKRLEAQTTEAYGAEFGLDANEAAKRLKRQVPLANAIQSISEKLDVDGLAGWGIDHENEQIGWVAVTDSANITQEIQTILANNPDIEIRSAEFSYKSLQDKQDQVSGSEGSAPETFSDLLVHTDIDMKNNQLVVALDASADVFQNENSKEEMLQQVKDHFASTSEIPVNVTLSNAPKQTVLKAFVGGYAFFRCTSGFTTQHDSGEFGVLTAGHCPNRTVHNGGGPLEFIVDHEFGLYDIQLHAARVRAKVSPYFAFGRGGNDFIKQTGTMARRNMMGLWVCNHGWLSGYSCGTVRSLNYRPRGSEYPANLNFRFVSYQSNQLKGCAGDSGGPVFAGSTALGIISGGVSPTDNSADCTTKGGLTFFGSIRESLDIVNSKLLTR